MTSTTKRAEIRRITTAAVQLEPAQPGENVPAGGAGLPGYSPGEDAGGLNVPLVDLPMMSDYAWQLGALKSRLEHPEVYAKFEDVEETVARLRQWLAENEPKGGTL